MQKIRRIYAQLGFWIVSTRCANCVGFNEPKETEETSESVETQDKGDHECLGLGEKLK